MPEEVTAGAKLKTWLVAASGALAGARYPVGEGVTRVGRAPDNDSVLDAPDCSTVSSYHLELSKAGGVCRVRDLGSTNGTWIDGASVTEAEFAPGAVLRLGNQ